MATLRSVIAHLAMMVRCAGILYTVIQVATWHSFYTDHAWHLAGPALAVAWAVKVTFSLRRHKPSPFFACVDAAFYLALALGAQACVPGAIRGSAASWLVVSMSGQLIVSAWYAPGGLYVPLALSLPLAYGVGAALQSAADARTLAGSVILLLMVGLVHGGGRRFLYRRAVAADAELARDDQAARKRYAVLCRDIERREHERLLHDTVLNTLTALSRPGGTVADAVTRSRQDVALIEAALSAGDPDAAADDLGREVRAVVVAMQARGLTVHLEADATTGTAVPARVIAAISNAVREALSNVAAHAGTGEAWVSVRRTASEDHADVLSVGGLRVVIRDRGAGFDLARADPARLGLRRSITERTAECGGEASIWSAPGQGAEVSLTWPAPGPNPAPPADHMLAAEGLPW
jgi:signal transduction histidine kinase